MPTETVKKYWFKPMWTLVRLVREISQPMNKENGGSIDPRAFLKKYPRAYLTCPPEIPKIRGWIPVIFHNPHVLGGSTHESYWIAPHMICLEGFGWMSCQEKK